MTLSPLIRRMLAIALLIAALAGGWGLVAQPWLDAIDGYDAEIEQLNQLLVRYRRLAEAKGALAAQLEAMRRDRTRGQGLLAGTNAQLAAAELQNTVKRLVESNGSVMRSTQVLPMRDEGAFRQVGIRVSMEAGIDGMYKILYGVESANPYLFIANLDIRSRQTRTPRQGADRLPGLTINYDVFGYMRAPAS